MTNNTNSSHKPNANTPIDYELHLKKARSIRNKRIINMLKNTFK